MKSGEDNKTPDPTNNSQAGLNKLIDNAISGDERAFRQLYDQFSGKMYSLCKRFIGDTVEADDVFQEGFLKIYKKLGKYGGNGSFEGWLRKIFINTCIDHMKARNESIFIDMDFEKGIENYQFSEDPTDIRFSKEDLLDAMNQMPSGYRLIMNLYLVEGYSHKAISELLQISEGTSKSQLFRAKIRFKEIMKAYHG